MAKLNSSSKQKEAKELLADKVADKPLKVHERLNSIASDIKKSLNDKDTKITKLTSEIDKKYPYFRHFITNLFLID